MARVAKLVQDDKRDPPKQSSPLRDFDKKLRPRVAGQDEAVRALVDLCQAFCAKWHSPGRPVGNLLFLRPAGLGHTGTVEAAAEILFGESRVVIKVWIVPNSSRPIE